MNLVNKDDIVDAIESTDWYHVNSDGKLVSGANSDEDVALYKEADIYKAIESVEPVDAIPVEWVKEWINKNPELVSETVFELLEWTIEDWKAEQEKHNET